VSDWQRRDGDALRLTVNRSRAVVPTVMTVFAGCRLTWIFRPSINQGCDIDALVCLRTSTRARCMRKLFGMHVA
jgi:hypothetical protein